MEREYIGPMFRTLLQGLSLQVPSACRVCRAWPSVALCGDCVEAFAQPVYRCPTCALAIPDTLSSCKTCAKSPTDWDQAFAAVDYGYPWDRLIADFKFRSNPAWARYFAAVMRSAPWVEPALEAADWVVPMPLSRERLRDRGFNQSSLLARQLCPAKVQETSLLRVIHTPAQSGLPRQQRLHNLQHAFAMEPLNAAAIEGKRVILVDDVMTSGATLGAASQVLRRAGAKHISAMVFARTVTGYPHP